MIRHLFRYGWDHSAGGRYISGDGRAKLVPLTWSQPRSPMEMRKPSISWGCMMLHVGFNGGYNLPGQSKATKLFMRSNGL